MDATTIINTLIIILIIFLAYRLLNRVTNAYIKKCNAYVDTIIRDTVYDESKIIDHLNYIIREALDSYVLLNIKPKQIYYINTKLENEIIDYLKKIVPDRISKTLITHLSFIYNQDYIGKFIGNQIYLIVLEYVLEFNMDNSNGNEKK